jgi:3-hydroxyisobutyrate dehydrogenase-like beta-hydroxyacid dehydrogenase
MFDIRLMQKDIVLALEAARDLGVPLPAAAAADELLTIAPAHGHEHQDLAALFQVLREQVDKPLGATTRL